MQTLIVYFSKYGNTRKLAELMAETFGRAGEVRRGSMDEFSAAAIEPADLVVVGSPTHGFTVPEAVRSVFNALPDGVLVGKSVAAFDTTVKPWPLRWLRASPKLLRYLRKLGGQPVAQPETFFVETSDPEKTGRMDLLLEGELEHGRRWAGQVLERARAKTE